MKFIQHVWQYITAFFHWIHIHPYISLTVWVVIAIAAFLWFTQDVWRGNPEGLSPDEMMIPWPFILILCLLWPAIIAAAPFIFLFNLKGIVTTLVQSWRDTRPDSNKTKD